MTVKAPLDGGKKPTKKRKIPDYLIRETIDGVPFYYAGFKAVVNKKKNLEEIIADSGLQSIIKAYLMKLFAQFLDWDVYKPVSGEVGNHLDHRSNLALDVAVYENAVLTPDKITEKFIDVHPKIAIEIDVRVTLEDTNIDLFDPYILDKVKKLLSFGTERIIWILPKATSLWSQNPVIPGAFSNWTKKWNYWKAST